MYERLPVPNFYETFKGDGKERYLKSRVNPSTTSSDMVEVRDYYNVDWGFSNRRCSYQNVYGLSDQKCSKFYLMIFVNYIFNKVSRFGLHI